MVFAHTNILARIYLSVPRWRTMMLPAKTLSPPNFLTPSLGQPNHDRFWNYRLLFYVPFSTNLFCEIPPLRRHLSTFSMLPFLLLPFSSAAFFAAACFSAFFTAAAFFAAAFGSAFFLLPFLRPLAFFTAAFGCFFAGSVFSCFFGAAALFGVSLAAGFSCF